MIPKLVDKETEDVVQVLDNANDRLKFSGYNFSERHHIIESGITNYQKRKPASNVKGQTLHTSFSFHFGNNYISLSDKNRDAKRNQFQNLKFLIIDEISMVKSDMLYQLDRRLREITQKMDEESDGVALLCFGDILQLKP